MLRVRATGQATEKRPDLAVENLDDYGRTVLLDVTTTNAGAATNVSRQRSSSDIDRAAAASDEAKRKVYAPLVDPTTQHFMPVTMELSGRWGPSEQRLFSPVSERARDLKGLKGASMPASLATGAG